MWTSSNLNLENCSKFLLPMPLLLQWWLIKLNAGRPRTLFHSLLRRACRCKVQATELRRTHPARPPPKPDPDPRLLRKLAQLEDNQLSTNIATCLLRCQVFLNPIICVCFVSYLLRHQFLSALWPMWIVGCLLFTAVWFEKVWALAGLYMDLQANRPNKIPTIKLMYGSKLSRGRSKTRSIIEVRLAVTDGQLLEWCGVSWMLLLIVGLCRLAGYSLEGVDSYLAWPALVVDKLLGLSWVQPEVWMSKHYLLWWQMLKERWKYLLLLAIHIYLKPHLFFQLMTTLPIKIVLFFIQDIPSAFKEAFTGDPLSKLKNDLEELLGGVKASCWDWISLTSSNSGLTSPAADYSHDLTKPHTDDYCVLDTSDVDGRIDDLPSADSKPCPLSNVPTVKWAFRWRTRRWIRRVCAKHEEKFQQQTNSSMIQVSDSPSSSKTAPPSASDSPSLHRFLRSFNAAKAGIRLLQVERYDRRTAPRKKRRVSVCLKGCYDSICKQIVENVCLFPAYEELVCNVFGPGTLPLIIDTGASCCVSPTKDDFIPGTYRDSQVKIKDLSGSNKVAGKGMLRWTVVDNTGCTHDIEIEGYHVPQASVRLLSPQSLYKKFGGNGYQDEFKYVMHLTKFGIELHAPYGRANLPILPTRKHEPASTWADVFLFESTDTDIWTESIVDARNQNLSAAQKELLLWHHRLLHAGLSKIHNLC